MKTILNKLLMVALVLAVSILGYYTHRLWVFAAKVSYSIEYSYAAIDCLIQESGQNESDVNVLFKGYKSRKAYYEAVNKEAPGLYSKEDIKKNIERKMYNEQIPECHDFYSRYRCWMLDPHDPLSLDGCGKHFGLSQGEIDTMKKDPSTIDAVMQANWDKKTSESKDSK